MKNLIYVLVILALISCKKEEETIPTISIERIGNTNQSFIVPGQSNLLMYELKITSLVDVEISEIQLNILSGTSFKNNVDILVVVNNFAQDMVRYFEKEVSLDFEDLVIKSNQTLVVKLFADIHDSVKKGESISLSVKSLKAFDMSRAIVSSYSKPLDGPVFTVK